MLEVQLLMAMGLALQQPLGLALAHHQACHLLHCTHALVSQTQMLTASPLLHVDMLRVCSLNKLDWPCTNPTDAGKSLNNKALLLLLLLLS